MATSIQVIRKNVKVWESMRSFEDLCRVIKMESMAIYTHAKAPTYRTYEIPKKVGYRLIEDPCDGLKYIQKALNDCLQAGYYYRRPGNVYGFCISATSEVERNIITHAERHLGAQVMLNIDLKDFFHQVSRSMIVKIYAELMPKAERQLIDILTALSVYKERLPMGAPTSPILSNFAMIGLDAELDMISKMYDVIYTRYADDLTFSTREGDITDELKDMINDAISHSGFNINPTKVKMYGHDDVKIVTGLVVGATEVRLPTAYLPKLKNEVEIYRNFCLADARYRTGMSHRKLDIFQQEIAGKINFAAMVKDDDPLLCEIIDLYNDADNIDHHSYSWLEIPYY